MHPRDEYIPDDEWEVIVRNVPIVSVDLVVFHDDGIVLAKRQNKPAKGEWFVPGGRVQKHESLRDAVYRVAKEELGVSVEIVRQLGVYEHFYNVADVPEAKGKHYLANGFVVEVEHGNFELDDQHDDIRTFHEIPDGIHEYVQQYIADAAFDG